MGQELRTYAVASAVLGLMWLHETTVPRVWPQLALPLMVGIGAGLLFLIRSLRALPKGRARPPHVLSVAAVALGGRDRGGRWHRDHSPERYRDRGTAVPSAAHDRPC